MTGGLDGRQLLEIAIRPALARLGPRFATRAAEHLVLGTAAVESSFTWLRQHSGPALGLWQMEPATYRWLTGDFLSGDVSWKLEARRGLRAISTMPNAAPIEMAWNLQFGAALCRLRYFADDHELPDAFDIVGQGGYWKRVYNSRLGAGKPDDYLRAWERLVAPWIMEVR